MNPKNSKKSPIHDNAGANITSDFGDGDISRSRSFLSNTCDTFVHTYAPHRATSRHIASSIIGRYNHDVLRLPTICNCFVTKTPERYSIVSAC